MGPLGTTELIIILIIVVLVFGVGRISKLGSEMGKGISAFRDGMKEGRRREKCRTWLIVTRWCGFRKQRWAAFCYCL